MIDLMLPLPGLSPVSGKTVVAKFDGGLLSSDGGILVCAPKARITCGGRFHPESCRLIRWLTSDLVGQLAGSKPRDKGRLGRLSDPAGRNASEV